MVRQVNLIKCLPLFIAEYKEIQHIMDAENPEFQLTANEGEKVKDNQFIISCDSPGISRFERLLKITPSFEDTLESRISRVLIRWNDVAPYTWKVLLQKINSLCGNNFEINTEWGNYKLNIVTHLDSYGQLEEFKNILDYIIPSNIEILTNNILNYDIEGGVYVYVGVVFCEVIELTDF